jgi:hypothetical protein
MSWWQERPRARDLDEATVALLRATSSAAVLCRVDHLERTGLCPYTRGPGRLRWGDQICLMVGCTGLIVRPRRLFCSDHCMYQAAMRRFDSKSHRSFRMDRHAARLDVVRDRRAS